MQDVLTYLEQHPIISDIAVALLILLATWVVSKVGVRLELLFFRRWVEKTKTDLDDRLLDIFTSGFRKIIWILGFYIVLHNLDSLTNEKIVQYGDDALYVLAVLIVASVLSKTLQTLLDWYSKHLSSRDKGKIQDEFQPLLKRMIFIIVYLTAIIFILNHFQQNISSLIVSLGVGSLAVALAAKDTLANMIAGFMIMTDRPFRLGDRIQLEAGEKGDVYDIGLRTTKILTFDNTLIIVPNQQIINEKVTNLSYPDPQIRVSVELGVAYGTDLKRVKDILIEICEAHPKVLSSPAPQVYFVNFGDSSLDLKVVCRVAKWGEQWGVGEELRMEINSILEKEGIEIPFPQHVVTMKKNDDSPNL